MEQLETQERPITNPTSSSKQRRRKQHKGPLGRVRRFLFRSVQWRILLATLLVIIVVVVGGQAVLITDAISRLNDSYTSTSRVLASISTKSGTELTLTDFERLQTAISDLIDKLSALDSRTSYVQQLTALNPDWKAQAEALRIAQELAAATNNMLTGFQPSLFYMVDGEANEAVVRQISSAERIVELLEIGRGRFDSANQHLSSARQMLDGLDLSVVSPGFLITLRDIEDYYNQIYNINTVLIDAPDILTNILGFDEAQTYLVLSQNSDEIRPSGGYVSTFGWFTVRNGRITEYDYYPTTTTSPMPPDADLVGSFTVPDWWIRYDQPLYALWDGSWFASFPRTAEMAQTYYNLGEGNPHAPVDGVIAIDIRGFEKILEALESVRVERVVDGAVKYEVITSDNFRDVVYNIRAYSEGPFQHKEFIADVYNQIFADWQALSNDPEISQRLLGILLESLLEKHIMIYSPDSKISNALEILGWSGRQAPGIANDYLMVADANLGNKSNRSISRQLTYDVTINPDSTFTSRVTVAYDYPDSIARNDPAINAEFHGPLDYNNLLQVFVPKNTSLISADSFNTPPTLVDDESHTIFVSRVRLAYDSAERFQFTYQTAPLLEKIGDYHIYRLHIQKQPGILIENVNVQVSLPLDAKIIGVSPSPAATYTLDNIILDFRTELKADQWFEVIFDSDMIPSSTP